MSRLISIFALVLALISVVYSAKVNIDLEAKKAQLDKRIQQYSEEIDRQRQADRDKYDYYNQ